MTMVEATIVQWLVDDGEWVNEGDVLLTIDTEKSEIEVESPGSGVLRRSASEGDTLPAGAVVGTLLVSPNADLPVEKELHVDKGSSVDTIVVEDRSALDESTNSAARRPASPNARRVASDLGVDLTSVHGSGPNGRVISEDVEKVAGLSNTHPASATSRPPGSPGPVSRITAAAVFAANRLGIDVEDIYPSDGETVTRRDVEAACAAEMNGSSRWIAGHAGAEDRRPMSAMRRTIGRRMLASLSETAQLTLTVEVQMEVLIALREQLKHECSADNPVPSINDFVLRATALALLEHPNMNARIEDDNIVMAEDVHLGMAVSVDGGLVVPVIRHAADMPLSELAKATRAMAALARNGNISNGALSGATFSVSNLGGEGVEVFTPILNPPNVGILGVGRIRDGVAWNDDGPRRERFLSLSLTWDHRALDGVPAARFARAVKSRLERPTSLLL
jgi:pyruvate/2-oxoglutarate dehydrogenase complex dihydrolipoamide acyltransferase (E2) component